MVSVVFSNPKSLKFEFQIFSYKSISFSWFVGEVNKLIKNPELLSTSKDLVLIPQIAATVTTSSVSLRIICFSLGSVEMLQSNPKASVGKASNKGLKTDKKDFQLYLIKDFMFPGLGFLSYAVLCIVRHKFERIGVSCLINTGFDKKSSTACL